ncbi:type I restriction-modification system restriction subunit R [Vibrio ponticus]|nr:type I restriction-modification system restriction subunit R [Vibrio ponticus]
MTHYRLHEQCEADLRLGYKVGEEQKHYLDPTKEVSGTTLKDPKTELLNEIIEHMNDIFIGSSTFQVDLNISAAGFAIILGQ